MQLDDRAVHPGSEPEVVGIHNETVHSLSVSTVAAPAHRFADIMTEGRNGSHARRGRLAQLVRAPALQAGCRGFESLTAHHSKD